MIALDRAWPAADPAGVPIGNSAAWRRGSADWQSSTSMKSSRAAPYERTRDRHPGERCRLESARAGARGQGLEPARGDLLPGVTAFRRSLNEAHAVVAAAGVSIRLTRLSGWGR